MQLLIFYTRSSCTRVQYSSSTSRAILVDNYTHDLINPFNSPPVDSHLHRRLVHSSFPLGSTFDTRGRRRVILLVRKRLRRGRTGRESGHAQRSPPDRPRDFKRFVGSLPADRDLRLSSNFPSLLGPKTAKKKSVVRGGDMESQARNARPTRATTRAPAMLALSSSGRLTEGASLVDALRAELATAPRPPTGAPVASTSGPAATTTATSNNKSKTSSSAKQIYIDTSDKVHPRPPVVGANDGTPTERLARDSLPWSELEKADVIPW